MDNNDSVSIFTDAVSHPVTSVPLATGALLTIYSLTFAPFVGGFAITFPLGLVIGVVGAGHGIYKFCKGQKDFDSNISKQAQEKLRQAEEKDRVYIQQKITALTTDFSKLARAGIKMAREGISELKELLLAGDIVAQEIKSLKDTTKFSADFVQIEFSAKELLKQGISLLCKTRDLLQSLSLEDEEVLTEEIKNIKTDISNLEERTQNEYTQKTIEVKKSSLASKEGRLKNISNSRDLAALLLSRVDECENTLRSTYTDLIKMNVDDSEEVINNVLSNIQYQVKLAMEIRKQYSKNQTDIGEEKNGK